jgi:tetratricopeptide (TPR) repeat protein
MNNSLKATLLVVVLVAGAFLCVMTAVHAYRANGQMSFPLDDPWIHLQFAKNLHQFGSYSYYRDVMVTSGSTSPLFTILLALGFFLTGNEMVLAYSAGILFLLLASLVMFALSRRELPGDVLPALAAAFLFLAEPRSVWASLSGMETTLFIFLLLETYLFYRRGAYRLTGLALGLLLWTRPEALIFLGALVADWAYAAAFPERRSGKSPSTPPRMHAGIWQGAGLLLLFAAGYAAFNLLLSGSVFPNTYAAKIKYYSHSGKDFPEQVFHFLTDGHMSLLAVFAGIGGVSVLVRAILRRPEIQLLPLLVCLGMFFAYWNSLPYLYQEGRYLMPVLPFMLLVGLTGLKETLLLVKKHVPALARPRRMTAATMVPLAVIGIQCVAASLAKQGEYAEYCRYIGDRQVRAAHWIHDNLPEDAVIATHDIGAIGFYSGRKIVDMVGLVSPGMIERIGSLDRLRQFLIMQKATHVAVLRNWFEVVNQNPIYKTDERYPEILEIFAFDPVRTHFTPQNVTSVTEAARMDLTTGNTQEAVRLLEWAVQADPQSSRAQYLLGVADFAAGDLEKAKVPMRKALELHPEFWDVYPMLARLEVRRGNPEGALAELQTYLGKNPGSPEPYKELSGFYRSVRHDTALAREYQQRSQAVGGGARP